MKAKCTNKIVAGLLALAMVLLMLPVGIVQADAAETTYVLDTSTDLAAMAQGAKADGDTEVINDYFTIMYSAKNKIDGSNKSFDDGYTATQRLNFGGKTDPGKGMINSVKFTTEAAASVKIWWVAGDAGRQFAIYDNAGTVLSKTAEESVKNSLYISELSVDAAGTYYLGVPDGSNYLFKLEVTVEAADEPVSGGHVLDATADLAAMAQGAKADGDTEVINDYFTIMYSAKNKIDGSNKTFDDGYTATQRLNFGGKTDVSKGMINSVKFTTEAAASVKIWWVAGDAGRQFAIYDNAGTVLSKTAEESAKNGLYISELSVDAAGTYYLGVPDGSNYLFKLEVTEEAAAPAPVEYALDATADLAAMAQGAKADGDTEVINDYFTIMYSAKNKIDGSNKTFDDGYTATQRLNFGGKTDVSKGMINSVKFTTKAAASVKIWWVAGDAGRQFAIYDNAGTVLSKTAEESVKNGLYISELSVDAAGTYYLGVPDGSNYLFKVLVTEAGGSAEKPERADWAGVEAPVISAAADNGDGEIEVTVSANVGYDGGDEVVVTMYDAEGSEVASKRSIAEKAEHKLTFEPTASGEYTFKAVLSREGEESKQSEAVNASFSLPLGTPSISSATSAGGGKVSVVWTAVDEATGYELYCNGELAATTADTSYTVSGLTVGEKYTFTVAAVRDAEKSGVSAEVSATVTENAQRVWSFAAFGASISTSSNGYEGSINEAGAVTVYSEGGKGKIVPSGTDGVAFYYTAIPTEYNFTLKATVTVDSWTFSNGQEGFGLMAADRVAAHGDSNSQFWNNSVMALSSKIEYNYDAATDSFGSGVKYSMKQGLGTLVRTGVTAENLATITSINSVSDTLDNTAGKQGLGAGTYNIIGNATNAVEGTIDEQTTFILELQKNNTGYFVTYYAEDGTVLAQHKYYGADILNQIDPENVYVGFFAARNARATFSDVSLSTILASEDAPAEERPIEYIQPTVVINSASTANGTGYTAYIYANVAGSADLYLDGALIAEKLPIAAATRYEHALELSESGSNKLEVVFTPDPDQDLGEFTELTSTDPIESSLTVSYTTEYADQNNIYVSPKGSAKGSGHKDHPLDIYTAVKYVQPGQTIILMEGTYKLSSTVKIEHGIDGTMEKPIRMVADPEAATRPVLDFQKTAGTIGISHGGDYWYFQGFDVTGSGNGQPGFVVSGHYNVLDRIEAYYNGNTGIQIRRYAGSDPVSEWPSNNLILNCTSYGNADAGYEDADGFAAKQTIGANNVFDGCVAHHNADDGWDLFANIGVELPPVTIRNCVAYSNGYLEDGTNAGNGNGFKMGGNSVSGKHKLINSYAFFNKAKGIDSNSGPDIIVENSISYNNQSYNVAFYTNAAANTDFAATGIISFKDDTIPTGDKSVGENLKPKGTQDTAKYLGDTNYYWDGSKSVNASGAEVTADWFVSLQFNGVERNADGTINMQGFLELTDAAAENAGARPDGMASGNVTITPDPESDPTNPGLGDLVNPAVLLFVMMAAMVAMIPAAKARKNG